MSRILQMMDRRNRRTGREVFASRRRSSTIREWPVSDPTSGIPWHLFAFGFRLEREGNTGAYSHKCFIQPGVIRRHGKDKRTLTSEASVTMSTPTAIVYLWMARAGSAPPSVQVTTTDPTSNNSHLALALVSFTYDTEKERYDLERVHHTGDFNFDLPL